MAPDSPSVLIGSQHGSNISSPSFPIIPHISIFPQTLTLSTSVVSPDPAALGTGSVNGLECVPARCSAFAVNLIDVDGRLEMCVSVQRWALFRLLLECLYC